MSNKIKEGSRVVGIGHDNTLMRGTVQLITQESNVAVVKWDNNVSMKTLLSNLAIEDVPSKVDSKHSRRIEKSEIVLTPEEYRSKTMAIIENVSQGNNIIAMGVSVAFAELFTELFIEVEDERG